MKPPKPGEEHPVYCEYCQKLIRWVIWGEINDHDETDQFTFTCEECQQFKNPDEEKISEEFDELYKRHMNQHEQMKDIEFCHRCGLETCVCVVCEVCGYHTPPGDAQCSCVRRSQRLDRLQQRRLTPGANDLTVQFNTALDEEAMMPYHET